MNNIDSIMDFTVFVRIVAEGSLSGAARSLSMSLAVISKRLARLEDRLGVRLIHRTTRRLSLTEEGLAFHERCVRILAEIEEAQEMVANRSRHATGLLRVTASAAFARRQLAPRLGRFHALYPDIRVQMIVTDTLLDLVKEGIDVAIRQAALADSSLMVRRLAPTCRVISAAPAYIAARGAPVVPADLVRHDCIIFGDPPVSEWTFMSATNDPVSVRIDGVLSTNDGEVAHAAALAGLGIVRKTFWDVSDDIAAGRLVPLLTDYPIPAFPVQAVYPTGRHLAPKLRVFLDFMVAEMKSVEHGPAGPALNTALDMAD
ncbi:LysR family transcriptional regulator [Kaistia dalseonensis]|uniref:DNA-binding transcriptional LysR family regulator n=1 Tax=Kaistia dalseonensis TaxID=410840 RepID=A0ABU0H5W7_9HYPH|nr:LysR family transcriptional regulator [Kaistia dalseonensis]MCX5495122.1 LysR family transcriptional regulator [Kaistia dalseonensis]MDQ0437704.1 DNA-binding transcriptional LysR family regulator [Kaistia dalseonensis]